MAEKRGRGRPPKEREPYTKTINLRITEEQYQKLAAEAQRRRMETGEKTIEIDVLREFINSLPSPEGPHQTAS